MPRGTYLSEKEKGQIEAFRKTGWSISAISREVKRSRDVVKRYLDNTKGYGTKKPTNKKGKITPAARRLLVREASKGEQTASQLKVALQLPISKRRVQQILSAEEHLKYKKVKQAPPLTDIHKTNRLNWARKRHAWSLGEWGRVVFSDEKKFNLDGPDGFAYYWHDMRKEERVMSKRQKGGGGVMVWGAFSEKGVSKLAVLVGNQDSKKYVETLKNYLLPYSQTVCGTGWIFQQDNAAIHTSKFTKDWFETNNLDVMEWPARSPDLNPIENLWGILARRVYANAKQFDTVVELTECILSEWDKIDRVTCYNLVKSMTKRCATVLERQGMKTDY